MRKINLFILFVLCLFIVAPNHVNASYNVSDSNITTSAIYKSVTKYYSRSTYNVDVNAPGNKYNPFPTTISYNDGKYNGYLTVSNWYISQNSYVVTYSGYIGPYASLSLMEVK